MSAAREKDQADFDLERFVDMFDEAMTSKDPRVIETLRSLMMIVTLTRPESSDTFNQRKGPLRRAFDDMNQMWKQLLIGLSLQLTMYFQLLSLMLKLLYHQHKM